MKVLYVDCFAGAAGDMILGALLDAGLPFEALRTAFGSLAVDGWDISVDRVIKTGITATKFRVHEHAHARQAHDHVHTGGDADGHTHSDGAAHHTLDQIVAAIGRSALSEAGKARAIRMFRRLGEVEASIHGVTLERVHLHEVGALDSIIDIVGAVFALDWFNADRIVVSPINVGGGMVRSAHGTFPVPAPATLALLKDAPVYSSGIRMETVTPTGALILTEYASAFGPMPAMTVDRARERLLDVPFDAERRRTTAVYATDDGAIVFCKGALETLLPLCATRDVAGADRVVATRSAIEKLQEVLA